MKTRMTRKRPVITAGLSLAISGVTAFSGFPLPLAAFAPQVALGEGAAQKSDASVASVTVGENTLYYESLQEALNYAATCGADATVTILADINLNQSTWTSVFSNGYTGAARSVEVRGNNHSISGLSAPLFAGTWSSTTLKMYDLTVKDSTITGLDQSGAGAAVSAAFIGCISASCGTVLSNCHVFNCNISGGKYCGGLYGYATGYSNQNDGPVFADITITNCSVSDCTISGTGSSGSLIGHATGDAWTAVNITGTTAGGNAISGGTDAKTGILIGTLGAGQTAYGRDGGVWIEATESNNTLSSGNTHTVITGEAIHEIGRIGSSGGVGVFMAGGSYSVDPTKTSDSSTGSIGASDGYEAVRRADGVWSIAKAPAATIGGVEYDSLSEALAKVDDRTSLESVSEAAWPSATPVYYDDSNSETSNYYATLDAAMSAANTANGSAPAKIYCRPGTNVTCASDHPDIMTSMTIYGNGSVLTRGAEMSIEGNNKPLNKDITVKIVNLGNSGFWGGRCTSYTVDLYLINCKDAHEICFRNPSTGSGRINITANGCTFNGASHSASCSLQSKFDGTISISDCEFTNVAVPVNFNNIGSVGQSVSVLGCTFTDCAISGNTGYDTSYCAPIRVVAPTSGVSSLLTVENCTFTYTSGGSANGDVVVGEQRVAKAGAGAVSYRISGTAAALKAFMVHAANGGSVGENGVKTDAVKTYVGRNTEGAAASVDSNGGSVVKASDVVVGDSDGVLTASLPAVTLDDRAFSGWSDGVSKYAANTVVAISKNTAFVAQWSTPSSGGGGSSTTSTTTSSTTDPETGETTDTKTTTTKSGNTTTVSETSVTRDADGNVVGSTESKTVETKTSSGTTVTETVTQKDAEGNVVGTTETKTTEAADGSVTTESKSTEERADGSTTTTESKSTSGADGSSASESKVTEVAVDGSFTVTEKTASTSADGTASSQTTTTATDPDGNVTSTTGSTSQTRPVEGGGQVTEATSVTKTTDAETGKELTLTTKTTTEVDADGNASGTSRTVGELGDMTHAGDKLTVTETDAEGNTTVTEDEVTYAGEATGDEGEPSASTLEVTRTVVAPDGSVATTTTSTTTVTRADGSPGEGWEYIAGDWYFVQGGVAAKGEAEVGRFTYVFDKRTGAMKTGWDCTENGEWRFLCDDQAGALGAMFKDSWVRDGSDWYMVDSDGGMLTGWQWVDGEWYYLNPRSDGHKGAMRTGWVFDGRGWYYLDSADGHMVRDADVPGGVVGPDGRWRA